MTWYAYYHHGSVNSIDNDICYIFHCMPSLDVCKKFCEEGTSKGENRNIAVIKEGIVTEVYKGTSDEVNNALFKTYRLHKQDFDLLINRKVERDIPLKIIRAVRIILSHLSRSQYREKIKEALSSEGSDCWRKRYHALLEINLEEIDFSSINKKMTREDILKVIAFQVGQVLGLTMISRLELYTKYDISVHFPILRQFMERRKDSNVEDLNNYIEMMITQSKGFFDQINICFDVKNEIRIDKMLCEENEKEEKNDESPKEESQGLSNEDIINVIEAYKHYTEYEEENEFYMPFYIKSLIENNKKLYERGFKEGDFVEHIFKVDNEINRTYFRVNGVLINEDDRDEIVLKLNKILLKKNGCVSYHKYDYEIEEIIPNKEYLLNYRLLSFDEYKKIYDSAFV